MIQDGTNRINAPLIKLSEFWTSILLDRSRARKKEEEKKLQEKTDLMQYNMPHKRDRHNSIHAIPVSCSRIESTSLASPAIIRAPNTVSIMCILVSDRSA